MKRRTWSIEEKLNILNQAEQNGITGTIRKYGIYSNTLYQWKEKLALGGEKALGSKYQRIDPELLRLQKENLQLKELIAEKELALKALCRICSFKLFLLP